MQRYDKITVQPYLATVAEHTSLDAVAWCEQHTGIGGFSFNWVFVVNRENQFFNCVVGEFGFSDQRDYVLFSMTWC